MALLDMVGVASIMPFVAVFSTPDAIDSNPVFSFINKFYSFSEYSELILILGFLSLTMFVLSVAFKALTTYLILRYSHLRNHSIGQRLLSLYFKQSYENLTLRHSSEFSKMVLGEVQQVTSGIIMPLLNLFAHGAVVVVLMAFLLLINPEVAITMGSTLALAYLLAYLVVRKPLTKMGISRVENNQIRFETINEAFGGIKELKVNGVEYIFQKRFDKASRLYATTLSKAQTVVQLPRYALEIVAFGGMLTIFLFFTKSNGQLNESLPLLAVYGVAGYRLLPSLQAIYGVLSNLRFSRPALERLTNDFINLNKEENFSTNKKHLPFEQGIYFKNISYKYPGSSHDIVNKISFNIKKGSVIGIAGPTGSGKSTIIDLLLGLLQPSSGDILVDDLVLNGSNIRNWQKNVGYVPQEIYLVHDTISANIAFGIAKDNVNLETVKDVAKVAQIHDFITRDLKEGYNTNVGERGVRLSGGQRQRIGIARALYNNPKILILDEATSALDNVTEDHVVKELCNSLNDFTLVMIAHRLTTLRTCDKIFVINQGILQSEGTFDELVSKDEMFSKLKTKR